MKILIASDKFKGSLSAEAACNAIEKGVKNIFPEYTIKKIPLADGGEGSLEVLQNTLNFKRINLEVNNPFFEPVKTFYGLLGKTAFIEMAKASGMQLLKKENRNPLTTATTGTGEMIADAIKRGAKKIYLFVGGSATNDCGIGMATAFGYKFKDEQNNILKPTGKNLIRIKHIDTSKTLSFKNVKITVLTDVNNILYGKNGAAYVFAKQKGASDKEIKLLDDGLRNISQIIKKVFGKDVAGIKGGGAAGGIAAGAVAFCNAKIKPGADAILDLLDMNNHIKKSDLIITGEGLLDKQTLQGKAIMGLSKRCKKLNKPFAVICGNTTLTKNEIKKLGAVNIKTIINKNISQKDSMQNAFTYLVERSEELIAKLNSV